MHASPLDTHTHTQVAARLFDVFMASHPLMPLYVGVAVIQGAREQLLACTVSKPT
jgi:hypothetical protein